MTSPTAGPALPDHRPRFPARRGGIGILGCGQIAQTAHLPAYEKYGLDVVGVWSRTPDTTASVPERFPGVGTVYDSPEELLSDPRVEIVDVATGPEGRVVWLNKAVEAGKHVLAQKPLTTDVDAVVPVLEKADRSGVRIAVNQNARWAPPWRLATLLVEQGAVGEVVAVTHVLDKPLPPLAGTAFDQLPHMLLTDYLVHWVDITRCWLEGQHAGEVRAHDHRTVGQPTDALSPWGATWQLTTREGGSALVRVVGDARTEQPSCPFWVHGTSGTIRGSLLGNDHVSLETPTGWQRVEPEGAWFVDGFAGTMGELMCSIEESRQPFNSAWHNLATLRLVEAARASAEMDGGAVGMEEPL